ncbi:MAG: 4Fe-4S binding protein [Collinsella aerofaciens]
MAQEHDLFDDIIEISKGFDFLKNPLGGVTDALDPSAPQWNPADYKERPRGNTIPCLTCKNEKSGCTACMDVCPVNAIEVEEDSIEILDSCRKCGLCAAACPTEAIISPRLAPKNLYDDIVSAATSHETAYVTCTRALKRMPRENEVVVACVGDITAETWFSVLADYPNVSVYLPLGVCDKCRNTGGEDILGEAIAKAEWSGTGMGLEVDPKSLKCHKRREYERKEYMDKIARTTGLTVTKLNPATAALASVTQKLKAHRHQITQLERTLNTMCGTTTTKRRRSLTHGRQLVLSTLQNHPELAQNMQVGTPECDFDKCIVRRVRQRVPHVCLRFGGKRSLCTGVHVLPRLRSLRQVCPDHALKLVEHDASIWSLSTPRPRKAAQKAKAHEEAQKAKAEAKAKLDKMLDQVEKLAD